MSPRPAGSAALLRSHARLLLRVTRSDLSARYAGSLLGVGWVLVGPALILGVYAVVYIGVFKLRLPGLAAGEYVVFIFSGLVPFLATAEGLSGAAGSVVANRSIITNTVFPIDLVPVNTILMSQVTMAIGLSIVVLAAAVQGFLPLTAPLALIVWVLFAMALTGVGWVIALLNVLVRDLQLALTALLMTLLIASPIAFIPEQVPSALKPLIVINPFAWFVMGFQRVLVLGEVPGPLLWLAMAGAGVGFFSIGSLLFSRAKFIIADHV